MKQETKNTFLATAVVAGLLSLPMTWMTLRNAQITAGFGELFGGMTLDVTGLTGHLTFLVKTPLWFIVLAAIGASVLQFMHSTKAFTIPDAAKWGVAGIAVFWMGLASWMAITSGQITPGIGLFLGLYAAVTPLAMLCVATESSEATPPSEE